MSDTKKASEILAKTVRIITVPPILVTLLIIILSDRRSDIFTNVTESIISILLLGIVPVLAYPIQSLLSKLKISKLTAREGQRKLAFILSLTGYLAALIFGICAHVKIRLMLIYLTYFLSVLVLTIFNKIFKIRASGHACSVTGPMVFMIYFISWKAIFPCILLAALIVWSSLLLKRHTARDLAFGAFTCLIAFAVSFICLML
jgi:membrane-associated phospholipid phosphatase